MSEGLIGVLIGGAITFLSGFFIEHRKQKKDEIKFKREKLEALYFNYIRWEAILYSSYLANILKEPYKKPVDATENLNKFELMNMYHQIVTIVNLYFTNLQDKYIFMDKEKQKLIDHFVQEDLKYNKEKLQQAYASFEAASEELKKAMSDEVKKIEKSC